MSALPAIKIVERLIGLDYPTYFIADIAANHDGSLQKAKELIGLAKQAGADAVKFQHFRAEKIVSKYGFDSTTRLSHQQKWKKSVFQIYQDASVPWEWTPELQKEALKVGIHFFSAPYDLEAIDMLDPYVPAYKIGSGDITWYESLQKIAAKQKPVLLATGASTLQEVEAAVLLIMRINPKLCLMQCNTNYTAHLENFRCIQLNVLKTYARLFPDVVLGLSDHTLGFVTVLGAVALGARVIEKHFTNSRKQTGPDHLFSMEPTDWKEMVLRTRELESALGSGEKKVEENEQETVVIQRRCCRASKDLCAGNVIKRSDIEVLRPMKAGAVMPFDMEKIIGRKIRGSIVKGEAITWELVE